MDQKTLERLRPRDSSTEAILAALAAAAEERVNAVLHEGMAAAAHDHALLDPAATGKDIAAYEKRLDDARAMLRRLDVIEPELQRRLVAADAAGVTERQRQAVEEARQAFAAAAAAVEAALPAYQEHAAGVVRFCQLEQARQAALAYFRNTALHALPIGSLSYGSLEPEVDHLATRIGQHVVLPGLPGQPMVWGKLPSPPPTPPSIRYE